MPASPRPTSDLPARDRMPGAVRLAVAVLAVLTVLLLVFSIATWLGRETLARELVERSGGGSQAEAERFVLITSAPYLFLGVLAATSAIGLPRRRRWARFAGLATATALAVLTLMNALAVGGVTGTSLFVLLLAGAAIAGLLARASADWVRRDPAPR